MSGLHAEKTLFSDGGFLYSVENGKATLVRYGGRPRQVIIPKKLGGYELSAIGDAAFQSYFDITSIEIPNSVTSIGEWAFRSCDSLTEIVIPNSVESIGKNAFEFCQNLRTIDIPDSVTSIGAGAFRYCGNLNEIKLSEKNPVYTFNGVALFDKKQNILHTYLLSNNASFYAVPDFVTTIGEMAFEGSESLKSLDIPNSVELIGDRAFYDSGIVTISLPNSVTSIGDKAFKFCKGLTSIDIPDSVTSIGYQAFWNCHVLENITIPNSLISIGGAAFNDCNNIVMLEIPASTTSIGPGAFGGCYNLELRFSEDNPAYNFTEGVLFDKTKNILHTYLSSNDETLYTIPDSVTSIGEMAFLNCETLREIEIPRSVTSIGALAFRDCEELTTLKIPDSVMSIGDDAFTRSYNLVNLEIPNSIVVYETPEK